jgi:hypothetical protein
MNERVKTAIRKRIDVMSKEELEKLKKAIEIEKARRAKHSKK